MSRTRAETRENHKGKELSMALKRTLMAVAVAGVAMVLAKVAAADDMPFWGDGSPVTNRAPAVAETVVLRPFSSFVFDWRIFALRRFNSTSPATVLFVR